MPSYAIIEVEDGLTVVEMEPGTTPEEAAVRHGGVVVDPGPYPSHEEAYDAIVALEFEEEADDRE
jgi:hypothetical protein